MKQFSTVGIVGRGIIGSSWALVFARAGVRVRIWSRHEAEVDATRERIGAMIRSLRGTGLEGPADALQNVSAHASLESTLDGADYVQESVSESVDLKREILRKVERHTAAETVIGSSTSGLLPSVLADGLQHPERFLVVHPLTPPHLLPVTEICPGPGTSPDVVEAASRLLRRVGQRPIIIRKEIPGFALNRILAALMNEILTLVAEGVLAPDDADAMLTEGFGLRWAVIGPLAAMDLNAPGGIEDYLTRYGHLWDEVARSRGMKPALTAEVIAQLAAAMRRQYRLDEAPDRVGRRDRAIAELRRRRSTIEHI
jgi:3-hydroxyacyl-CoA dehydrogenase